MQYIIDGTACVGKTTFLKKLESQKFKIFYNDFENKINLNSKYKHKFNNKLISLTYQNTMLIDLLSKKEIDFIDRGPLCDIIYEFVIKYTLKAIEDYPIKNFIKLTNEDEKEIINDVNEYLNSYYDNTTSTYFYISQMKIFYFLSWNTYYKTYEKMIERGNNLDLLHPAYVCIQNIVFKLFATYFHHKIIQVPMIMELYFYEVFNDNSFIFINSEFQIKQRKYIHDIGIIDLSTKYIEDKENIFKIYFNENAMSLPGVKLTITPRSSLNQEGMCKDIMENINEVYGLGTFDPWYIGPLSVTLNKSKINESLFNYLINTKYCWQLECIYFDFRKIKIIELNNEDWYQLCLYSKNTMRGNNSFGSTGI